MSFDLTTSLSVLEEPGGLETVLLSAGQLPLLNEVMTAAGRLEMAPGGFASLAVRRFIDRAGDQDWTTLTSRANATEDALGAVIVMILQQAVGDVKELFQ